MLPGREAKAERSSRLGKRQISRSELAIKAQVDVQVAASAKVIEQVLAVGFHGAEFSPVQQRSTIFESAIRRFYGDNAIAEQL